MKGIVLRRVLPAALLFALVSPRPTQAREVGDLFVFGVPGGASLTLEGPVGKRPVTPRAGTVTVSGLEPGAYTLTLERAKLEFRIGPGETLKVRFSGEALQVVERMRGVGLLLDDAQLNELPLGPSASASVDGLDATTVLDRLDGGGLDAATPGLLGSRGSSFEQATLLVDGADITDSLFPGSPTLEPSTSTLSSLRTVTGPKDVDVGPAGPVLALTTRPPVPVRHGELGATFDPGFLRSTPASGPPPIERLDSFSQGDFSLGGPLSSDRLSGSVSGYGIRTRIESNGVVQPSDRLGAAASLLYRPSPARSARFDADYQRVQRPFAGAAWFGSAPVAETVDSFRLSALVDERFQGGGHASFRASYARSSEDPDAISNPAAGVIDRVLQGPLPYFAAAGRGSGDRLQARVDFEPSLVQSVWRQAPRFGIEVDRESLSLGPAGPRGLVQELVAGLPARIWDYGYPGPPSQRSTTNFAAFASDRILLRDDLTLDVGLRGEGTTGQATGAPASISWWSVAPRVWARWAPGGRLAFEAAWGRYYDRLTLDTLAYSDPNAPQGTVYQTAPYRAHGELVARMGPGGSLVSLDPNLRRPRTDEVYASIERRLGVGGRLTFSGIHRTSHDFLSAVDVGAPASDYSVFSVPDPGLDIAGGKTPQLLPVYNRLPSSFGADRYVLTNPSSQNSLFEGVDLTIQNAPSALIHVMFATTASLADGYGTSRGFHLLENDSGLIGELFSDPNASTNAYGRLFSERAYVIKFGISAHPGGEWQLGIVGRYQDGQPFARLVVVPDLNQGPEAIQAIPRGLSRFHNVITFDARLEKGFHLGSAHLKAFAEGFNFAGTAAEIEEDVLTTAAFRRVTLVQPPRVVRMGVRASF